MRHVIDVSMLGALKAANKDGSDQQDRGRHDNHDRHTEVNHQLLILTACFSRHHDNPCFRWPQRCLGDLVIWALVSAHGGLAARLGYICVGNITVGCKLHYMLWCHGTTKPRKAERTDYHMNGSAVEKCIPHRLDFPCLARSIQTGSRRSKSLQT